jgi:hypothetical protein
VKPFLVWEIRFPRRTTTDLSLARARGAASSAGLVRGASTAAGVAASGSTRKAACARRRRPAPSSIAQVVWPERKKSLMPAGIATGTPIAATAACLLATPSDSC